MPVISPHNKRLLLFVLEALCSTNESAESDHEPATQDAY